MRVSGDAAESPLVSIEPTRGWVGLKLGEVWAYRELLYFFTWRDIKVRYKQSVLGVLWAILQPFFLMVVFTIFFHGLAKVSSGGIPYPIFSYTALVPWTFFANGVTQASGGLVANSNMIKKIYFPRLTIPISKVLSGLLDFALAFIVLLGMMAYYRVIPTANVLFLPFFLLLALVTSLGVGLWLSAMNVQFRDVQYITPFLLQVWLFASPVVYSSSLLSQPWQTIYALNPMVGVIEGFRWALLGQGPAPGTILIASSGVALAMLVSGAFYFRRLERTFADVV